MIALCMLSFCNLHVCWHGFPSQVFWCIVVCSQISVLNNNYSRCNQLSLNTLNIEGQTIQRPTITTKGTKLKHNKSTKNKTKKQQQKTKSNKTPKSNNNIRKQFLIAIGKMYIGVIMSHFYLLFQAILIFTF
jgi:hypothetical protein